MLLKPTDVHHKVLRVVQNEIPFETHFKEIDTRNNFSKFDVVRFNLRVKGVKNILDNFCRVADSESVYCDEFFSVGQDEFDQPIFMRFENDGQYQLFTHARTNTHTHTSPPLNERTLKQMV